MTTKKAIIIGGGFAGIQTALKLSGVKNLEVTLISDHDHFQYYPALHTFLSISGTAEYVTVPLQEIFTGTQVKLIQGKVVTSDLSEKEITLESGEKMRGDYLVFATGSESTFFGIPGLSENAFPFQNISDAQKLRKHIEESFQKNCVEIAGNDQKTECVIGLHFVVVGAGPNGVDLAGELADFTKKLCKTNNVSESLITIHLIEGAPVILPMMSEKVQKLAMNRLRKLGVSVLTNRQLLKQDELGIELSDMTLGAKTVIWTAGATGNSLVTKIPGVELQKKNRITLDAYLQVQGFENVFAIGDIGDTKYAGLAQTAIHNGTYVAKKILADLEGKNSPEYIPSSVVYNIGVGHGWSIMQIGNIVISGKIASWMRNLINMRYFFSILPAKKVFQLFFSTKKPLV